VRRTSRVANSSRASGGVAPLTTTRPRCSCTHHLQISTYRLQRTQGARSAPHRACAGRWLIIDAPTRSRAVQQTPYRSARCSQAAHGPKKDAPLQQCRNSSAHTSTEDARAGWASAQTTINYARLGSRAKARARTWCRPRRSPDSTTGKATTPSRPFSTHSACAHMHPRKPRRREAHTVIDTGSIGSRRATT
jgi:hypothetical protein